MDPCLNQPIPVALPVWRKYSKVPDIPGYTDISSLTPIIEKFLGSIPDSEGQLNSDQMFIKVVDFEGSRECVIETVVKGEAGAIAKKKTKAFCKVSHLLDPALFVKNYYDHAEKGERRRLYKLNNPMNQAYIDTLANYLLGQLRQRNVSPHFCQFYGGWKATADMYRFNITDEFESYRRYKDFWNRRREGKFALYVEKDDSSECSESEDSHSQSSDRLFATPKSSLRSTAFSYSSSSTDSHSEKSHVSLCAEGEGQGEGQGQAQTHTTVLEELESVSTFGTRKTSVSSDCSDSSSDSSDCSSENAYSVFVEMKSYPVMMIFQEEADGVLDDLLEDDEAVGAPQGSAEWEARWTAWTFQVIAALCAAQGVLGFTHNDLHTNNIVWTATDDSWLFYKSRDGTVWRVPTYGRILRLIDFGRAIFRVGEEWFVSDDYESGGDAEGQYNFGRIQRTAKPPIYPNPSFDLCRYAVSIFEALFPEMPIENLEGAILSQERDWVIRETESPLWNLLWTWLLDNDGKNVLREENGDERFPDFDLYQHITENVTNVKPQDQIRRPIFSSYTVPANSVGDWETIYPLFC